MLENLRIKPKQGIFVAAALLLGLMSAPASASDWRLTAIRHTRFGLSLSFIDAKSIKGGRGQVQFSTLTFFDRQTRKMNRVSAVIAADCPSKEYRFQQIILFRNQQPLSVWHSTVTSIAVPQTNVYDSISSACGTSDLGMHVEGIERYATDYLKNWSRRKAFTA